MDINAKFHDAGDAGGGQSAGSPPPPAYISFIFHVFPGDSQARADWRAALRELRGVSAKADNKAQFWARCHEALGLFLQFNTRLMRRMKSFTGALKNTDELLSISGKNFCSSAIILRAMLSKILGKNVKSAPDFCVFHTNMNKSGFYRIRFIYLRQKTSPSQSDFSSRRRVSSCKACRAGLQPWPNCAFIVFAPPFPPESS